MLCRTVGLAATGALAASAFLLPPGIAPASKSEAPDAWFSIGNPRSHTITIPCSACAFPAKQEKAEDVDEEDDFFWIQGGANSLVLNFTVNENEELELNGNWIYPPPIGQTSPFTRPSVYVKQVPSSADLEDIVSGDVRSTDLELTAYGLKSAQDRAITKEGDSLGDVTLEILGLENEMMNVGEVEVQLLKNRNGELLIMSVEARPNEHSLFEGLPFPPSAPNGRPEMPEDLDFLPPPPPPHPHGLPHGPPHGPPHGWHNKECKMLPAPLCKLRNIIESKILGPSHGGPRRGGCPGRKGHGEKLPSHGEPPFDMPEGPPRPHHGRPHHMRPHGPHHHGHHHHGHFRHHFLRAFARGLIAILIPVMAGITVGITVSLVGLALGRLIGFLWIRLVRGGRRGSASIAQQEVLIENGEDKAMLAEMEAPPVYEDAPAYEEAVDKTQKEEK